jgi:Fic/DOC family protein
MPDWDKSSPQLTANLRVAIAKVRQDALRRANPELALAKNWHELTMQGLSAPSLAYIKGFRGEAGLADYEIHIMGYFGVRARAVAAALKTFERELQARIAKLDRAIASKTPLTGLQLGEIIDLCAWGHSEWVRIHPFANGNGRSARMWANFIAMRYGLPPFVRLRPRPNHGYEAAGGKAMQGEWKPTVKSFKAMLKEFLSKRE